MCVCVCVCVRVRVCACVCVQLGVEGVDRASDDGERQKGWERGTKGEFEWEEGGNRGLWGV